MAWRSARRPCPTPSRTPSSPGSAHRSPDAQAVARAGAVIGRCFVPDVLAGIMDVPPEALDEPLQELVDNFVLDAARRTRAVRLPPPAPARRDLPERAGSATAGGSTPGPASSGADSRGSRRSTPRVHYERAGLRREAFETALAGARDGGARCPPTARRSSCIAGPSTTCRTTSSRASGRRSSRRTPTRRWPSRRTTIAERLALRGRRRLSRGRRAGARRSRAWRPRSTCGAATAVRRRSGWRRCGELLAELDAPADDDREVDRCRAPTSRSSWRRRYIDARDCRGARASWSTLVRDSARSARRPGVARWPPTGRTRLTDVVDGRRRATAWRGSARRRGRPSAPAARRRA